MTLEPIVRFFESGGITGEFVGFLIAFILGLGLCACIIAAMFRLVRSILGKKFLDGMP